MEKALICIILLVGLAAVFRRVANWFEYNKNINIVPASVIEMVAVIIFMFTYGSTYTNDIIWMWISIAIVLVVTIFNFIKYGFKDGLLASFAELAFSLSTAFLIACILVSKNKKYTNKSSWNKWKYKK